MPPPTSSISSVIAPNGLSTSGSRSRPQARRKQHDDAPYFAPPTVSASAKRQAADRADGEPRVKRKRLDTHVTANSSAGGRRIDKQPAESDSKSMIDFAGMPSAALYRYLMHFDLIPIIQPSTLSAQDPPPPYSLLDPRNGSRGPSPFAGVTPANRPKRDPKEQSRRRCSRLLEEESAYRTPILTDVGEVHMILARIAERHFRDNMLNELDALSLFMVRTKCE